MLSKWFHCWICIQLTFFHCSVASDGSNNSSLTIENITDFYNKADAAYFQPTTISLLSQFLTLKKDLDWGFLFQFRGLTDKLKDLPQGQDLKTEFNLAIRTDTIRQIYNLFSLIELKSIQWFWGFVRQQKQLGSLDGIFQENNERFQSQFIIYKINLWMHLFKNVTSWGVGLNPDEQSMEEFFQKKMDEFIKQAGLPKGDEFRIFDKSQTKVSFNEALFQQVNNQLPEVLVPKNNPSNNSNQKDDDQLRKNYAQLFNNTHKIFFQTIRDNNKGDNKIIFDLTKLEWEPLSQLQTQLIEPTFFRLNTFFFQRKILLEDIKSSLGDSLNSEKISVYESTKGLIGVVVDLMFIVEEDFVLMVLNQRGQNLYVDFIKKLLEKTIPNLLKNKDLEKFASKLPHLQNIKQLEMVIFYKNLIEVPVDKKNYTKATGLFAEIVKEFQKTIVEEVKASPDWSTLVQKTTESGGIATYNSKVVPLLETPKITIDTSFIASVPAEKKTTNVLMAGWGVLLTLLKKTINFLKNLTKPKPKSTPQSLEVQKAVEASINKATTVG